MTPLQDAKRHLKNAFITYTNNHGKKDKPAIYEYLNNVQDSIIKDLPNSLTDRKKDSITDSLANYNCKLRKDI